MAFPVIISFYTKGTPYQLEVHNLIESCKRFQLETAIEGIESFGPWDLNCAFKPFFILKKLEELKKPILWVDADGVFMRKPTWQEAFNAELSVRIEPDLDQNHSSKVISSTVYVNYSSEAKELLQRWIFHSKKILFDQNRKVEFWDQVALRDAIFENPENVRPIPLAYAKIFDHLTDCQKVESPVIEHYQASRRFKNLL